MWIANGNYIKYLPQVWTMQPNNNLRFFKYCELSTFSDYNFFCIGIPQDPVPNNKYIILH